MNPLITILAFAAITLLFVVLHLRRRPVEVHPPTGSACPRCAAPITGGSAFCPACHVPLQAYELVGARIASGAEEASGPVHAVVRADRCVGCATCVAACPEPGAIHLVGGVAIVNLEACKGHGLCAAACPVGAIVVTSGAAVQRVEVPEVDAHFQSNVPGLYVVGELGGRGLIKNAVNEGKIAAEHAARVLGSGPRRHAEPGLFDLLVVGSGPAGLSAGLEAMRHGLHCAVLEQGSVADSIRKYPRKKLLLAEPVRVPLYGDLWVADGSKEMLLKIWQSAIAQSGLDVRTEQRVQDVQREPGGFRVVTATGEHRAQRVVLALGRRGTPRRLGVPGEEQEHVYFDIVEMEAFAGSRVLVVGGGDSAIESALGIANQPDTEVTLSYRGAELSRVKERNRVKLGDAVTRGKVVLLLESQIREIRAADVVLEHRGGIETRPADFVIVRIGGEAPYPFLERIGVHIVSKELALAETPAAVG